MHWDRTEGSLFFVPKFEHILSSVCPKTAVKFYITVCYTKSENENRRALAFLFLCP